MSANTPVTDALLLEINEGRVYKTVGPVTELCREFESALREYYAAAEVNIRTARDIIAGIGPEPDEAARIRVRWLEAGQAVKALLKVTE